MDWRRSGVTIASIMVLIAAASVPASIAQVTPTITGPHVLPGAGGAATRVSEMGVVLCHVPGVASCVWSEATGTVYLPGAPNDMNDAGMVVGSSNPVGGVTQAWVWTVANGLQY